MTRPTIRIHADSGEADVTGNPQWNAQDPLWRLDILNDMIADLRKMYDETHAEFVAQYEEIRKAGEERRRRERGEVV